MVYLALTPPPSFSGGEDDPPNSHNFAQFVIFSDIHLNQMTTHIFNRLSKEKLYSIPVKMSLQGVESRQNFRYITEYKIAQLANSVEATKSLKYIRQ